MEENLIILNSNIFERKPNENIFYYLCSTQDRNSSQCEKKIRFVKIRIYYLLFKKWEKKCEPTTLKSNGALSAQQMKYH